MPLFRIGLLTSASIRLPFASTRLNADGVGFTTTLIHRPFLRLPLAPAVRGTESQQRRRAGNGRQLLLTHVINLSRSKPGSAPSSTASKSDPRIRSPSKHCSPAAKTASVQQKSSISGWRSRNRRLLREPSPSREASHRYGGQPGTDLADEPADRVVQRGAAPRLEHERTDIVDTRGVVDQPVPAVGERERVRDLGPTVGRSSIVATRESSGSVIICSEGRERICSKRNETRRTDRAVRPRSPESYRRAARER